MKQCVNRILSFVLIVSIFIATLLYPSISVYAKPYYSWEELKKDATTSIFYIASQLEAVTNGSFADYVQGLDAWENYWNEDNVTVDDSGNVGYSEDLTSLIKQALIDYSEETNGFYIVRTTPFSSIDPQQITYKATYTTLSNLVNQCKLISVNSSGGTTTLRVTSLSFVYDEGLSFVYPSSTIDTPRNGGFAYLYDDNWVRKASTPLYTFSFTVDTPAYGSLASGELEDGTGYRVTQHNSFSPNYCLVNHGTLYKGAGSMSTAYGGCLISNDGRNVRVFKNLDAFKLYTTNNRSVYFAKDFYESTPGEISGTWDEIADSVANIDKSLSDLLDKIDSTTDENTIEDLLQQILDEMKNQGGSGDGDHGGGGSGGGNYDDTGLLAALSGYFDSVLAKLDAILSAIEALVWIEADDSNLTDDQKDLFDLIDKIWDNPETGSQEMADELSGSFLDVAKGITKKFPFSIPWDIHALFSVFARAGQSQPETAMLADGYGIMPLVGEPDDGEYDYSNGDGTSTVINWNDNPHDAPYFVLPLVVESYGIEEYIEVDLKDFQTVSTLSRSLLAVLFAVFLIKFTITLMEFFKGGD